MAVFKNLRPLFWTPCKAREAGSQCSWVYFGAPHSGKFLNKRKVLPELSKKLRWFWIAALGCTPRLLQLYKSLRRYEVYFRAILGNTVGTLLYLCPGRYNPESLDKGTAGHANFRTKEKRLLESIEVSSPGDLIVSSPVSRASE